VEFFFSTSGRDANDCLSESTPCRTARRFNGMTLIPGDVVRLRAGDVWTEQSFTPKGNGEWDEDAYTTAFDETLAVQKDVYLADTAYTGVLLADGVDLDTAGSIADSRAAYLALGDAVRAGHEAADTSESTRWITLTSYGEGDHPLIRPGGTIHAGVQFGINGTELTGGFKIVGIDIDQAWVAGILFDHGPATNASWQGVWIEDVKITNVTGMPVKTYSPVNPGLVKPYNQFCAQGITMARARKLRIKNVEIGNVDAPFLMLGAEDVWVSGLDVHDVWIESAAIGPFWYHGEPAMMTNFLYEDSTYTRSFLTANPAGEGPGYFRGESGPLIAGGNGFLMKNVNVSSIEAHHTDGIGIDWEVSNSEAMYSGMLVDSMVTDTEGSAFLANDSVGYQGHRILIDNCTFARNGNKGLPAIMGKRTTGNQFVFTRCDTTRALGAQKLFGGDATHVYSPTYDTPQDGMIFGPSNAVR
jgi:hypothetical protein